MPPPPATDRLPFLDALKGAACLGIVAHHLAFYGPMSDAAQPLAPALMAWLSEYARMAVQVFLVAGGFLAASALAPRTSAEPGGAAGATRRPAALILRRYRRLAMPFLAAMVFGVAAAAIVRPWLAGDAVPAAPSLPQLLAHVLLLHDLLDQEALSAGVWYVAIDLQLFALSALLFAFAAKLSGPTRAARCAVALVLLLALGALVGFNRDPRWDETALYFFGAYGLGMLAFWAGRSPRPLRWVALIAVLGGAALALEWRDRIAVALATALVLVAVQRSPALRRWPARGPLPQLGRISYSVFLIHFPVCLLVALAVSRLWPGDPWPNALGMVAAFGLSVAAGALLYHGVERRQPSWRAVGGLAAALLVCGTLAAALPDEDADEKIAAFFQLDD